MSLQGRLQTHIHRHHQQRHRKSNSPVNLLATCKTIFTSNRTMFASRAEYAVKSANDIHLLLQQFKRLPINRAVSNDPAKTSHHGIKTLVVDLSA
jgi:hypothetical protein